MPLISSMYWCPVTLITHFFSLKRETSINTCKMLNFIVKLNSMRSSVGKSHKIHFYTILIFLRIFDRKWKNTSKKKKNKKNCLKFKKKWIIKNSLQFFVSWKCRSKNALNSTKKTFRIVNFKWNLADEKNQNERMCTKF